LLTTMSEWLIVTNEDCIDEILLFAYVDGELSVDQRQNVEALLARDASTRILVAQFRELNRLLKAAYDVTG
jgi:anti-sigma factor RsiW